MTERQALWQNGSLQTYNCWKLAERKTEPQKENKGGKHKISLVTEVGGSDQDDEVLMVGQTGFYLDISV